MKDTMKFIIEINSEDTHALVNGETFGINDVHESDCDGQESTRLELEDGREFVNHNDCHPQDWQVAE